MNSLRRLIPFLFFSQMSFRLCRNFPTDYDAKLLCYSFFPVIFHVSVAFFLLLASTLYLRLAFFALGHLACYYSGPLDQVLLNIRFIHFVLLNKPSACLARHPALTAVKELAESAHEKYHIYQMPKTMWIVQIKQRVPIGRVCIAYLFFAPLKYSPSQIYIGCYRRLA